MPPAKPLGYRPGPGRGCTVAGTVDPGNDHSRSGLPAVLPGTRPGRLLSRLLLYRPRSRRECCLSPGRAWQCAPLRGLSGAVRWKRLLPQEGDHLEVELPSGDAHPSQPHGELLAHLHPAAIRPDQRAHHQEVAGAQVLCPDEPSTCSTSSSTKNPKSVMEDTVAANCSPKRSSISNAA